MTQTGIQGLGPMIYAICQICHKIIFYFISLIKNIYKKCNPPCNFFFRTTLKLQRSRLCVCACCLVRRFCSYYLSNSDLYKMFTCITNTKAVVIVLFFLALKLCTFFFPCFPLWLAFIYPIISCSSGGIASVFSKVSESLPVKDKQHEHIFLNILIHNFLWKYKCWLRCHRR